MRILKILLLLISAICICFLMFTIGSMFLKQVVWYQIGLAFLGLIIASLNFVYHVKSMRYYRKNNIAKGIEQFSKLWLIAPLIFSGFFLWVVFELVQFLIEKIEIGLFHYLFFDGFLGAIFMFVALLGIKELIEFYMKIKNGTIHRDEISDIGTPVL